MKFENKKAAIGVWGLGRVGLSAVTFFTNRGYRVEVTDQHQPDQALQDFLDTNKVTYRAYNELDTFLKTNDFILPSPGVDLRPYTAYSHKWLTELTLFQQNTEKPVLAVTGTTGKTTVTTLLGQLLNGAGLQTAVGGNIGTPMLDLLADVNKELPTLLELSSFQLDLAPDFAPDIALWTNFFDNHLDRHGSRDAYFKAKCNLFAQQTAEQKALIPLELVTSINTKAQRYSFSPEPLTHNDLFTQKNYGGHFYYDGTTVMLQTTNKTTPIATVPAPLLPLTFTHNWLSCLAALHLYAPNYPFEKLSDIPCALPPHRMEYIGTINGVTIYNDSKATTTQATLTAVQNRADKPIILMLGGTSKGVDRTPFVLALAPYVKMIICFGKEAATLSAMCQQVNIKHKGSDTLELACQQALEVASPGDQILFSPAGASFDLFTNYEERGEVFKQLITKHLS